MVWDDELKDLSRRVLDTFGEDARERAIHRALNAMQQAMPDDLETPFDADAVTLKALRAEFGRLLQPH